MVHKFLLEMAFHVENSWFDLNFSWQYNFLSYIEKKKLNKAPRTIIVFYFISRIFYEHKLLDWVKTLYRVDPVDFCWIYRRSCPVLRSIQNKRVKVCRANFAIIPRTNCQKTVARSVTSAASHAGRGK